MQRACTLRARKLLTAVHGYYAGIKRSPGGPSLAFRLLVVADAAARPARLRAERHYVKGVVLALAGPVPDGALGHVRVGTRVVRFLETDLPPPNKRAVVQRVPPRCGVAVWRWGCGI